ncbi:hypothetical protein NEIELOOT_02459 [Neisseria elongata subsp. glycolytica ATCC 29315]|uniref:Uncharacterized protein n=1 Tax=Neisseria elongata subsp. glycolytica ATCC 29315 TaxID=546263 RepID=D4DTQ2_NEIEG|nr:hypothetical protein NEIELOOT_02459 [Neisseria elongata subsp. glycolytica ATCC 29315]
MKSFFRPLPRACLFLKQGQDVGIGCGDFSDAAHGEVVGIVGVAVAFVAAEKTPAAVVVENRLFAVHKADGAAGNADFFGGDAEVECGGKGLGKLIHRFSDGLWDKGVILHERQAG